MAELERKISKVKIGIGPLLFLTVGESRFQNRSLEDLVKFAWGVFSVRRELIKLVVHLRGLHPDEVTPEVVVDVLKEEFQERLTWRNS